MSDVPMTNNADPNGMRLQTAPSIREQFAAVRATGKRAKDAAEALGLSEGAAIAAHAGEHEYPLKAVPLQGSWLQLLQSLEVCGPLMALTRNEGVVHEKTGIYTKISATGPLGLALGEDIDLRLFFAQWHAGFAVTEAASDPARAPQRSLQFFNAHGRAVHKVFVREATDLAALDAVVQRFAQPSAGYVFGAEPLAEVLRPDTEIDAAGLREAWAGMQDTHEFFGLTKKFTVERQQSFRLVEGQFAWRLAKESVTTLLQGAAASGLPIMVFVSSGGCIQIHTGPVNNIKPLDTPGAQWINVLDPGFNLHLRTDMVASVWLVEKPTADGVVTSVEAFDPAGELMAMFFGARKPGKPELQGWRDLAARLPRLQELAHAA
ncbi:hemin-degrading factor [Acidovorax sp. LjRoot118]|uniref:hemin-degrading factor n=1 Tax=Acidovorax sp. LjRoot118 TaxID=3342256 RepID=UPI003ECD7E11